MDSKSMIELQKKEILMHRLVYVIVFFYRILLQFLDNEIVFRNTLRILGFIVLCAVLEEVFYHNDYFGKILVVRILRYVQCMLAAIMLCFMQSNDSLSIAVIAILIMFLVDFFLTMSVAEKDTLVAYMLYVGIPILVILIFKISTVHNVNWFFMFFNVGILLLVLFFEAMTFVNYMRNMDSLLFSQRHKLDSIAEKNENILQMQEKLKSTNNALTLQKIDLQNANRMIKMANEEIDRKSVV